jgi:phage baseplate assembly protein W
MRRDYGSRLFQLVDAPINRATLLDIYASTAEAVDRWEPRYRLESVKAASAAPGRIELELVGTYLPDGQEIKLTGIIID